MKRWQLHLCAALLALNLAFIWGNSMLPADLSAQFSDFVQSLLAGVEGSQAGDVSSLHLLRKMAHFTEFLLLGLNLCWLFLLMRQKGIHGMTMTLLCGCMAACVDETIQLFVPGRSSSLVDVWIDMAGVTAGMILLLLGQSMLKTQKKREQHHFGG